MWSLRQPHTPYTHTQFGPVMEVDVVSASAPHTPHTHTHTVWTSDGGVCGLCVSHTHTRTHTHTHTHLHTHMYSHRHTYIHTHAHAYTHSQRSELGSMHQISHLCPSFQFG